MAEQQPIINLEWLDEEVRQYRNELTTAQQRINAQDEEIRQLARHVEDLEGRLVSTQTQLNRINVLERALDQYKEEIRLLIMQQDELYQEDRRETARIKLIEQDNINRAIAETRKGLAPIPRLQEEIEQRAAEERRLNDAQLTLRQKVMDLEKRIDTSVRSIPHLEEQRGRDAKYIAQLQEQVASLTKNVDGITNRFLVVEEMSHRNRQSIEELVTIRSELQQRQRRFLEEMQMVDQQRERLVREWEELENAREQRMQAFSGEMRAFSAQYQKVDHALTDLEALGERLQREQHEVSELQRLAEERQKTKMEEWESQAEKRWQREKLLWEQQWHDHDRRNIEQLERLRITDERSSTNEGQVAQLWEILSEDIRLRTQSVQDWTIKISEQIETRRDKKRAPG
jgi:chromosome segregation ATPase